MACPFDWGAFYCVEIPAHIEVVIVSQGPEPLVWDTERIKRLKCIYNYLSRDIDFWFEKVIEGYIIKFSIEYNESFSCVEEKFNAGLINHMLKEIPLWIKMLLLEKGLMNMGLVMMDYSLVC